MFGSTSSDSKYRDIADRNKRKTALLALASMSDSKYRDIADGNLKVGSL